MLKFIGTGSAFNTKLGNNSAYIKEGNTLFLIDCGSANFHTMKESGLLDDVEHIHVYITHTHADHVGSLADLIFYMYYAKGKPKKRVTVYSRFSIYVDKFLEFNGVTKGVYKYHAMSEDEIIEIEDLGIGFLTYKTTHVDELPSYGLIIDDYINNKFAVYTGDTNTLTENINKMFEESNLDFLYVDTCSQDYDGNVHLSLFKLHQTVKKEHRHKVYCMHIDEKFDKELARSLGFKVAEISEVEGWSVLDGL